MNGEENTKRLAMNIKRNDPARINFFKHRHDFMNEKRHLPVENSSSSSDEDEASNEDDFNEAYDAMRRRSDEDYLRNWRRLYKRNKHLFRMGVDKKNNIAKRNEELKKLLILG